MVYKDIMFHMLCGGLLVRFLLLNILKFASCSQKAFQLNSYTADNKVGCENQGLSDKDINFFSTSVCEETTPTGMMFNLQISVMK